MELLISIKNLLENLRSALDFVAQGLFQKYGRSTKSKPKIYFPYALETQTKNDFNARNRIEQCIPGLRYSRPDIALKIESYQHFSNPVNKWLPQFMELNNENKHKHLTPQTKRETKVLRLSSQGLGITMGEGASISMGRGTSIRMGNMIISGNQKFDVKNPPITLGSGKQEVIKYVSFTFDSNSQEVLTFLKKCIEGVEKIINELSSM